MSSLKVFNIITVVYVLCSLALSAWIGVDLYYNFNPENKKKKGDSLGRETDQNYLNANLFTGDKLQDTDPVKSSEKNDGIISELYKEQTKNKLSDYQNPPKKTKLVDKSTHKKVEEDTKDGIFTELYRGLSNKNKATKSKQPGETLKTLKRSKPRNFADDFEEVKPEDENYGIISEISGHPTKTKLSKEKIARLVKKFAFKRIEKDVDIVDPEDENFGIMSEAHGYHIRTKMSEPKYFDEMEKKPDAVKESIVPKKVHVDLPKPSKPDVEDDTDRLKKNVKEPKGQEKVLNGDGHHWREGVVDKFFE